jgi:transcriptional regulator with XRE-family HTH domain
MDRIKLKIKEIAERQKVSIPNIAAGIGMTKSNMYNILSGNQKVSLELLEDLCKFFNVPMKYWFDDQEQTSLVREDGESYVRYMNDLVAAQKTIIDMKDQEIQRMREEINLLKSAK